MSTAAADEKSSGRTWTVAFVVTVVLLNVVEWLTDWSRWVFFVPAAIISVAIVIYYRVKQRRRTQVRDGVQARDWSTAGAARLALSRRALPAHGSEQPTRIVGETLLFWSASAAPPIGELMNEHEPT